MIEGLTAGGNSLLFKLILCVIYWQPCVSYCKLDHSHTAVESTPAVFKVKGRRSRAISDQYLISQRRGWAHPFTLNLAEQDLQMSNYDPIMFTCVKFKFGWKPCVFTQIDIKAPNVLRRGEERRGEDLVELNKSCAAAQWTNVKIKFLIRESEHLNVQLKLICSMFSYSCICSIQSW